MIRRTLSFSAVLLSAIAFTSCANDSGLTVVKANTSPSQSAGHRAYSGTFTTDAPSGNVVATAASKKKDRHQMPVYTFQERTRLVRTTAYTCSEDDHLEYGSKNATGTKLIFNQRVRSAAADWSYYPVGTIFRIKGMSQMFVVDDYGSALTGTGTVDIYTPNKGMMGEWGRRNVELTVVRWGSFERSAEILSQRKKFSHCSQMLANIVRQVPDLARIASR